MSQNPNSIPVSGSPLVANPLGIQPTTFTPHMVSPAAAGSPTTAPAPTESEASSNEANNNSSDTAFVPQQEEVKTFYLHLKQKYAEVNDYVKIGRPQRQQVLVEIDANLSTLENVCQTISPAQQAGILPMVNNLKWEKQRIEMEINCLEGMVEPEVQRIASQLGEMARITSKFLKTLFVEYSWPTIQDRIELHAPQEVFNLIANGNGIGLSNNYLQSNDIMSEVRAYVQQALGQAKRPSSTRRNKNDSAVKTDNSKRYRKIIPFDPKHMANSEDARVWLSKY